jgi:hypothetical protein
VVIQPGAAQQPVFHVEAQRLDQVQGAAGVGRQADHVAGVGRDLGVDEHDAEHGRIVAAVVAGLSGQGRGRRGRRGAGQGPGADLAGAAAQQQLGRSGQVAPVVITSSTRATWRPASCFARRG